MTMVAEIARIRWAHFREGVSLRELARTFHHSRKTIRRALADSGPWSYQRQRSPTEPVMGAVATIVTRWLAAYRTPQPNGHAERWVGSARRECLDWLLIVNRRHLEHVLAEYVDHYNSARPHRSLGLNPPRGAGPAGTGSIKCRSRLGGLIHD